MSQISAGPGRVRRPLQPPSSAPLHDPEVLEALFRLLGSHDDVHELARKYTTWAQLFLAPEHEVFALLHGRFPGLRFAPQPPAVPPLPAGVRRVSRYEPQYPAALREVPSPPVVLYRRGADVGPGPAVAVGGAANPSPQGVEIARSATLAAVSVGLPVVLELTDGIAAVALRSALAAHGKVIVIVPAGLDQPSRWATQLDQVVAAGGTVLSEAPVGIRANAAFTNAASRLTVALARAVVLAEVGRHERAGAPLARAAVAAGSYLVVPTPQQHYVPDSALGLRVLAEPRSFSDDWYGTNVRIRYRVENGEPPADAVVASQREIQDAIITACGL